MKKTINKLTATGLMTFLIIASCSKELDKTDTNSPTQESYFKTATELQNGVNAIYRRDLGIHLDLLDNNEVVIYTYVKTDPYYSGDLKSTKWDSF